MSFKKWGMVLLLLVSLCPMVFGWEGRNGFSICTANNNQTTPEITSDGLGGAIITWFDYRNGFEDCEVYAQGIDNVGDVRWDDNGILIAGGTGHQFQPRIAKDNNNGAYIIWDDSRNGTGSDLYLQKINIAGVLQYPVGGMSICTSSYDQINVCIVEDGAGGAVMAWEDYSNGVDSDIYAQAISWENNLLYPENGVAVCTAAGNQSSPKIIADGQGGSIIVWTDERNGMNKQGIYAQAVNGSGAVQWTLNGVTISTALSKEDNQTEPEIVADGQGGAIICWQSIIGSKTKIMAQAIDSTGQVKWAANGVSICSTDCKQYFPAMISDGLGGAIIAWEDSRNSSVDIYAQAIDSTGTPYWDMAGVAICMAANDQSGCQIVSDGTNGAIISWLDNRNPNVNIYTQSVSSTGVVKWAQDGIVLSATGTDQWEPIMTSDGAGGAIVTWNDNRNSNYDIYAQSVTGVGFVPVELSEFSIE